MEPMLARPKTHRERIEQFLGTDYWLQQKLDGQRLLLVADGDGSVEAFNRRGDVTFAPSNVEAALAEVPFRIVLDSEVVAGQVVVFDLVEAAGAVAPAMPLRDRLAALERIVPALGLPVTVARTARTPIEKEDMMAEVIAGDGEGWMAKRVLSKYVPGERSRDWRKLKRYQSIDCVVESLGSPDTNDKMNMSLALYRDGELVNVGECTRLAGTGMQARPGSVVEVQCLYATDDDRLYQPSRPRVRTDKTREECTFDQLDEIRTNKRLVLS